MTKRTAYDVILAPVITEKATLASEANQVIFRVNPQATKPEIKAAIEALFKVKVKAVNTVVRKGKLRVFKGMKAMLAEFELGHHRGGGHFSRARAVSAHIVMNRRIASSSSRAGSPVHSSMKNFLNSIAIAQPLPG